MISHLLIQNGETSTSCCGPSSSRRFASASGLPIRNFPPAIGNISILKVVCASGSVYAFMSAGVSASAAGTFTGAGLSSAWTAQGVIMDSVKQEVSRKNRNDCNVSNVIFLEPCFGGICGTAVTARDVSMSSKNWQMLNFEFLREHIAS